MTTTIAITCPECNKQLKGPSELQGKKVRCKSCGHIFTVNATAPSKPAPAKQEAPTKAAAPPPDTAAKPAPSSAKGEEADGKIPYTISAVVDSVTRCPQCATEMVEGQVICLDCGYNLQTRARLTMVKTFDTTTLDWIIWLLPGISLALGTLTFVGIICFIWLVLRPRYGEEWYGHFSIQVWGSIISAGAAWILGRRAYRRLVKNFRPPEKLRR